MSSRLYPIYRLGNPQLRVFLPNFWMKLVKLEHESHSPGTAQFIVSSEMTRLDIKNYLERIYNVPVMDVRTLNHSGKTHQHPKRFVYKDPDYKIAYVTLPKDVKFEFPDVVKQAEREKEEAKAEKDLKLAKATFLKSTGAAVEEADETPAEAAAAATVTDTAKTKKRSKLVGGRKGLPSFFGL